MPRCRNCGCFLPGESAKGTDVCPSCGDPFWEKLPDGRIIKTLPQEIKKNFSPPKEKEPSLF